MPLLIINCFAVHFSSKKEDKILNTLPRILVPSIVLLYIFQVKKKTKSENKSLNDQGLEMDIAISQRKFVNKYALLKFSQETEINKNL